MQTGLERYLHDPKAFTGPQRVALLTNPTAVTRDYRHAADSMHAHPDIDLVRLFGPEHGIRGDAQDMIGVDSACDAATGLPVVSLYGGDFASLSPTEAQLADVDVLIYDIQDVGARYYTYAATLALCMQVAARCGVQVLVLDRPNPIGGTHVEGGGLAPGLENFCALYPIPQRHGLTVGELARLYNHAYGIGCALRVVECAGWQRQQYFDETDLPWVMPSPNMPTLDTAIVYPGMCLLEGTALSEGRGTTRPFELFGAPYIDGVALARELGRMALPGVVFRPCTIRPGFQKLAGQICGGLQLHVLDRSKFNSYETGLAVLWAVHKLWPGEFAWRVEPYEFRDDVPAIDLLTGFAAVRQVIDGNGSFDDVRAAALQGAEEFSAQRQQVLIYS